MLQFSVVCLRFFAPDNRRQQCIRESAFEYRAVNNRGLLTHSLHSRQHSFAEHAIEILPGHGIYVRIVRIGTDRQIDLGLGDMEKTPRLAFGMLARLRAREHVVGRCEDFGGAARRGAQGAEGLNERQRFLRVGGR